MGMQKKGIRRILSYIMIMAVLVVEFFMPVYVDAEEDLNTQVSYYRHYSDDGTVMDIITEEKFGVLLKFPKVVVGADLMIGFNDSSATSGSILYVMALPEEVQGVVNKSIFTIDVM